MSRPQKLITVVLTLNLIISCNAIQADDQQHEKERIQRLISALTAKQWPDRAEAVDKLALESAHSEIILPHLRKLMLEDEDSFVAFRAALAIAAISSKPDEELLAAAENKEPRIRRIAINALAHSRTLKESSAIKKIVKYFSDTDPNVREAALRIAYWNEDIVEEVIAVARNDKSHEIRITAIDCLGSMKGKANLVVPLLFDLLRSADEKWPAENRKAMRAAVCESLHWLSPDAAVSALKDGKCNPRLKVDMLDVLRRSARAQDVPLVALHLSDASAEVRLGAVRAVFDGKLFADCEPQIEKIVKSLENPNDILDGLSVINEINPKNEYLREGTVLLLKSPKAEIRVQGLYFVNKLSPIVREKMLPMLPMFLDDSESTVRYAAIGVIEDFVGTKEPTTLAKLKKMADSDPADGVRIRARTAYEKATGKTTTKPSAPD
jgi:hypothetical protein